MDMYQRHAPVLVSNFQKSIVNDAWRWEVKKNCGVKFTVCAERLQIETNVKILT
jgi:hypothetical protein